MHELSEVFYIRLSPSKMMGFSIATILLIQKGPFARWELGKPKQQNDWNLSPPAIPLFASYVCQQETIAHSNIYFLSIFFHCHRLEKGEIILSNLTGFFWKQHCSKNKARISTDTSYLSPQTSHLWPQRKIRVLSIILFCDFDFATSCHCMRLMVRN